MASLSYIAENAELAYLLSADDRFDVAFTPTLRDMLSLGIDYSAYPRSNVITAISLVLNNLIGGPHKRVPEVMYITASLL